MAMNSKDYKEIAKRLSVVRPIHPDHDSVNHIDPAQSNYQRGAYTYWKYACRAVAGYCKENNPKFDFDRFIEACHD